MRSKIVRWSKDGSFFKETIEESLHSSVTRLGKINKVKTRQYNWSIRFYLFFRFNIAHDLFVPEMFSLKSMYVSIYISIILSFCRQRYSHHLAITSSLRRNHCKHFHGKNSFLLLFTHMIRKVLYCSSQWTYNRVQWKTILNRSMLERKNTITHSKKTILICLSIWNHSIHLTQIRESFGEINKKNNWNLLHACFCSSLHSRKLPTSQQIIKRFARKFCSWKKKTFFHVQVW